MKTDASQFSNVAQFARWFLAQPFSALRPPKKAIKEVLIQGRTLHCAVLYRAPPYQVELVVGGIGGDESVHVPWHSHPNIDSVEVALAGDFSFVLEGGRIATEEELAEAPDGALKMCQHVIRIRPGKRHGAISGTHGAMFLSIQKWLNGIEPTSVVIDWEGERLDGVSS